MANTSHALEVTFNISDCNNMSYSWNAQVRNSSNSTDIKFSGLPKWQCAMSTTFRGISIFIASIVILAAFFGNGLILVSLRQFRGHFKGSLYMFLGNLAVADVFLAGGLFLHVIDHALPSQNLKFDLVFCGIKMAFTVVSFVNSGITLLFMSIDRFCAIAFPMRHFLRHRQKRRIWTVILLTWIVSTVCGFLPTMASVHTMKVNHLACRYGLCVPRGLTLFLIAFLLFQIVLNSILCVLVVRKVKRSSKSATHSRRKAMRSKSTLLIKVYVLFTLCWLPFIVLSILLEGNISLTIRNKVLCYRELAVHFGMLNSAMNWILYGLVNSKFRKAFQYIICCKEIPEHRSSVRS